MTANNSETARQLVFEHIEKKLEPTDTHVTFSLAQVYVVSYHFVAGSWKALVSTTLPDGMYYEVTFVEKNDATYITAYKQWEHVTIPGKGAN